MPRRILFIAHQATRTGSPMVLLHFMRWLRRETSIEFDTIVGQPGPLEADFARLARVYGPEPVLTGGTLTRVVTRLGGELEPADLRRRSRVGANTFFDRPIFQRVATLNEAGEFTSGIASGHGLTVAVTLALGPDMPPASLGVRLKSDGDDPICILIAGVEPRNRPTLEHETAILRTGGLPLRPGRYWIDIGLSDASGKVLDVVERSIPFEVTGVSPFYYEGDLMPGHTVSWQAETPGVQSGSATATTLGSRGS